MGYYAGLDVSMATTSICVEDERGVVVLERVTESQPEAIASALSQFRGKLELVGLEAGSISTWLTKMLREIGLPTKCICSRVMAAILSTQTNKTDRNDARAIARAMRCGNFREVHAKSDWAQSIKGLLKARELLVKTKTQLTNTVRGILKGDGILLPQGSGSSFLGKIHDVLLI